jgi:hypothetical protein
MKRKWLAVASLLATLCCVIGLPSCGSRQQLVSITLQPSDGFVFEGLGATGQFTAYGTYIHPPVTKDISDQVTWSLDIANFATLTQTGLITYTRTDGCGSGQVTATHYSDPSDPTSGTLISGSAPVKGGNDGTANCM